MEQAAVVFMVFCLGCFTVDVVARVIVNLRRMHHNDQLLFTVGSYEAAPRPGTLYPSAHPADAPAIPHYRITRVVGCVHRAGVCSGWREVYGVRVG